MLSNIRVNLFLIDNFLGSILSSVDIIPDKNEEIASTDGNNIYYNENFINELSKEDKLFIFAHETVHIALNHAYRAKLMNLTPDEFILWNIASDYVVNYELEKIFKLPEFTLKPSEKYYGKDTETIFNDLKKRKRKNKPIPECIYKDLLPNANQNKILSEYNENFDKCNSSFCENSNEFKRIVKTYYKSETPWNVILRNFYSCYINDLYSYYKPSRRSSEFYLPSRCISDNTLNEVTAYVDGSLSVSDELYSKFIYELRQIFIDLNLDKLIIKTFSNKINTVAEYTNYYDITDIVALSFGGTSIKDVIKDINQNESLFNIIFSDGKFNTKYISECNKQDNEVLWVIYNDKFITSKGFVILI